MSRIIQISDTHIVAPGKLANGVVDTAAALTQTVDTICERLAAIGPIDLVIITGDLTDHGLAEEYAAFLNLIAPLEKALQVPIVAIPGNHDHRERLRDAFSGCSWMPKAGPINVRLDLPDAVVIGLDTLVDDHAHGEISPDTQRWLAAELEGLGSKPLLLAMHHPPMPTGIALMDAQGLKNADALATLLHGLDRPCTLVAGHAHRSIASVFAGHPTIVCPGTSHAVCLALGLKPHNALMLEPGGIVLHDVGSQITSHALPVGRFAGPFPFA